MKVQTCSRVGCGNVGVANPELRVWRLGMPVAARSVDNCARMRMTLPHCERHAGIVQAADILSDQGWEQIRKAFKANGMPEPDRSSATIGWLPISQDLRT